MHTGKWFWKEEAEIKDEEKQLAEEEEKTAEKKRIVEAPDDDYEDEKPDDQARWSNHEPENCCTAFYFYIWSS